jgi:hypothetical protein
VYERAKQAGSNRIYRHTHESNTTARQLYDKVAQLPGFILYLRPIRSSASRESEFVELNHEFVEFDLLPGYSKFRLPPFLNYLNYLSSSNSFFL